MKTSGLTPLGGSGLSLLGILGFSQFLCSERPPAPQTFFGGGTGYAIQQEAGANSGLDPDLWHLGTRDHILFKPNAGIEALVTPVGSSASGENQDDGGPKPLHRATNGFTLWRPT